MTKTYFLLTILSLLGCDLAPGQSPPPPPVTPEHRIVEPVIMLVDFGQGKRKARESHDGTFDPVTIPSGQQVAVTLRFLPKFAGTAARLSALDGGELALPATPLIAADGTYTFQFRAGNLPGSYRFLLEAFEQYEFTFYGFDPANPPARGRGR